MAASTESNSAKSSTDRHAALEAYMESFVKITLSGLGGSLIGLARQKQIDSQRIVSGSAAAAAARRKRSPSPIWSNNLPLSWSLSCISFCVLVEGCRIYSPSTWVLNQIQEQRGKFPSEEFEVWSAVRSIGDYTIGGAVAGVLSSFGRNAHLRQRLPSSLLRGPQPMFGFVPGITLGFVAGLLQASIDYGENKLISLKSQAALEISGQEDNDGNDGLVEK